MGAIREHKDPLMVDGAATDLLWGNLSSASETAPTPLLFREQMLLFIFLLATSTQKSTYTWLTEY